MNKALAGAGALVLAGIGSVAMAAPGGAQSAEDIPSTPETLLDQIGVGGGVDEGTTFDLTQPEHSQVEVWTGGMSAQCYEEGMELGAAEIGIWQFDADGEPQLLDEGWVVSDSEFWGGDVTEFISEDELTRWLTDDPAYDPLHGANTNVGTIRLLFDPPATNGEQFLVANCIMVDPEERMEAGASLDDLEHSGMGWVTSYTVTGGEDPEGPDDEGPSGGEGPDPSDDEDGETPDPEDGDGNGEGGDDTDDADDSDDDVTTPAPTPVTGDPSLTG